MITLVNTPVPEHRSLLESLGFTLKETHKIGVCVWELDEIQIELHDTSIPTGPQVLKAVIEASRADGMASVRRQLLLAMGMPESIVASHGHRLADLAEYVTPAV